LVQLTGVAKPAAAPACVCRLHTVAVRQAALVSDKSALEACLRRCAIQTDDLYLFLPLNRKFSYWMHVSFQYYCMLRIHGLRKNQKKRHWQHSRCVVIKDCSVSDGRTSRQMNPSEANSVANTPLSTESDVAS